MRRVQRLQAGVLSAVLLTATAGCSRGSSEQDFSWQGTIPEGGWLSIRNTNGSVLVREGSGNQVSVRGTRRWRGGSPQRVHFETVDENGGVTVCAVWGRGRCGSRGYSSHRSLWDRFSFRRTVNVEFVVTLPRGVKLDASTINGKVSVQGAAAEVRASTVNGRVDVATSTGPVRASTINGSLHARVGAMTGDVRLSTVNGSITAEVPASLNADVDMSTVNGSVSSDLQLTTPGQIRRNRATGTIGSGGPELRINTVNGSVHLVRAGTQTADAAEEN
jgi:hypothetical protein